VRDGRVRAPAATFNHDVAPVLFAQCQPCHRPGQRVPFTLMTYADAKQRAGAIAEALPHLRRAVERLPERPRHRSDLRPRARANLQRRLALRAR
jgi:hypothetical protein